MTKIDSYDFGRIVIDGRAYTSDIIIFADHVKDGWWRKEGHRLFPEDLNDIIKERPQVLVVGTGYSGLMEIPPKTAKHIRSQGMELIAEKTGKAVSVFNALSKLKKVIAALHLTC